MEKRVNRENRIEYIQMRIKDIIDDGLMRGREINIVEIERMMMEGKMEIEKYNNSIKEWYDEKYEGDKRRYEENIRKIGEENEKYMRSDYIKIKD